ncbi:acyloxyacyl hydrolase [Aureitalea sp. L0-47]|uniref:acyloxyacyl hydrolase n=1 Tax=Aureitalea sp. L0-47 TaxID=2816962 RepID=UPI00223912C0|nr:acyloxyacyl hydrolase [Aureitalea sp. L0-47]MCW5520032.1 acyloxyacyl hydrolase [Aureitalea sp. L0-47]
MSRILIFLVFLSLPLKAQESVNGRNLFEVSYGYGTMLRHNKNVAHLVNAHPGIISLSYSQRTYGKKRWHREYNYPDWGFMLQYTDFGNEVLGENYALMGHYNFYFLNRKLRLRAAEGIGLNTNPFDLRTNPKNISYGSSFIFSTTLAVSYVEQDLFKDFGLELGVSLVHSSNGSIKAPNSGTNIVTFTAGLSYNPQDVEPKEYVKVDDEPISEPIHFNIFVRGGVNSSDYIDLGQHPFWVLGGYADKRLNYKSTLQLGAEIFFTEFLQEEIKYLSVSFPLRNIDPDNDYRRVGLFAGHEFRIGDLGIETQLGYYVYYPYKYESRVYSRVGMKYFLNKNWFGAVSIKSHSFNAEAIEFALGIRI